MPSSPPAAAADKKPRRSGPGPAAAGDVSSTPAAGPAPAAAAAPPGAAAPPRALPPIPAAHASDPLAGVASLRSGRGVQLAPASPSALMAALALFECEPSGGAFASSPPPPPLPTGAAWPVMVIVTPEGLQQHAVQPGLEGGVDRRDPSRLAMSKRRACEE